MENQLSFRLSLDGTIGPVLKCRLPRTMTVKKYYNSLERESSILTVDIM